MDFSGQMLPEQIFLSSASQRREAEAFLEGCGLRLAPDLEYFAAVRDPEGRIIGCGGFGSSTIKCVACSEEARGLGLSSILVSHLRSELSARGVSDIFLFTKPENLELFQSLAFYAVGSCSQAVLMESSKRGVFRLESRLASERFPEGITGAVVMNANPFTKGHLYLIEQALNYCDNLAVFPVQADLSEFSAAERIRLIREGTAHLGSRVKILDGGRYIISAQTFPTYFLKKLSAAALVHAALDVDIFARHIAAPLGISVRFAGSEPSDPLTAAYNETMLNILPGRGIKVQIIERLEQEGLLVSAGLVRRLMHEGRLAEIEPLVPPPTFELIRGMISGKENVL